MEENTTVVPAEADETTDEISALTLAVSVAAASLVLVGAWTVGNKVGEYIGWKIVAYRARKHAVVNDGSESTPQL